MPDAVNCNIVLLKVLYELINGEIFGVMIDKLMSRSTFGWPAI
jgi:hypothetical protein